MDDVRAMIAAAEHLHPGRREHHQLGAVEEWLVRLPQVR
jgi:hypothetical protein